MGRQTQYSPTAAVPPAPQRRGGECASLGHPPASHAPRPHIEGLHRITAPAQPTVGKGRPRQPLHTAGGRACRVAFTAAGRLPACPRGGQWGGGGARARLIPANGEWREVRALGPNPRVARPRGPPADGTFWPPLLSGAPVGVARSGTTASLAARCLLPPPPVPVPPTTGPLPGGRLVSPQTRSKVLPEGKGLCRPPVGVGRESSSGLGGTNTASALSARGSGDRGGARVWAPAAALPAPPLRRPPPASVSCAPAVTPGASTVGRNERR